jgi:Papain-like cysteine protease AvrRpt2
MDSPCRKTTTWSPQLGLSCLVLLPLLLASFLPPVTAADLQSVLISGVPHVRQKPDFCGEACAEMWLRKLHVPIDQDTVFDQSGLDPTMGRGCYTCDLMRALETIGFKTGRVWSEIPVRSAALNLDDEFAALHADLVAGVPSIVCMRYDSRPKTTEHFRLVLGYHANTDEVIYHDPAHARGAYLRMSRQRFLDLWPLKYEADTWTVVRLRMEAKRQIQPIETAGPFRNADYAQHIRKLRAKLPEGAFTIVLQRPFVVIGDEEPEVVRQRARDTVQWAVDLLKQDYFKKDPGDIIDIWLFQDNASYADHAEQLFGERPTTPYGYYSPRHRALVMNIATGGGTLVHEIVHPFIAANFPDCPAWFNEGLASLYEASSEKDGHIVGLTNWRLPGLQRAIGRDSVSSFQTLLSTTTEGFYDRDRGTNYAQARYLCYYLQERGLLDRFYHAFRKHVETDPSGYETLQSILGNEDMTKFEQRWRAWVLQLKFDG